MEDKYSLKREKLPEIRMPENNIASKNVMSEDQYFFKNIEDQKLFNKIIHELRCTVCQNQSLAESSAVFAQNLRQVIYQQVQEGRREEEITCFVVERYGEFANFKPPFLNYTLILWLGPIIMLLLAFKFFCKNLKKN